VSVPLWTLTSRLSACRNAALPPSLAPEVELIAVLSLTSVRSLTWTMNRRKLRGFAVLSSYLDHFFDAVSSSRAANSGYSCLIDSAKSVFIFVLFASGHSFRSLRASSN
jgi:hypothetical protein